MKITYKHNDCVTEKIRMGCPCPMSHKHAEGSWNYPMKQKFSLSKQVAKEIGLTKEGIGLTRLKKKICGG